MNEVRALVAAFDAAQRAEEKCALVTVVSVEGSAYRRPGARMLVSEVGASTGTISAGCLEADAIEHAKRVIRTGTAKLVEYNTATTSEEEAWGLGLGCSGIVRVLVEPLGTGAPIIEALRRSCELQADEAPISIATVYSHEGSPLGARVFIDEAGHVIQEKLNDKFAEVLEAEMRALRLAEVPSAGRAFEIEGGIASVFIESLEPPVPLVIFGAGHDVLPVVELARGLGWQTEVVDPQARPASHTRFPMADEVTLARSHDAERHVSITPRSMTLLMTHNYAHDLELLRFLLASPARYIGIMGPRKRTERMLDELGADATADMARLHSPAGLDIGANTPAEIALSMIAEMRAVLAERRGGMLRERQGSIHGETETVLLTVQPSQSVVLA